MAAQWKPAGWQVPDASPQEPLAGQQEGSTVTQAHHGEREAAEARAAFSFLSVSLIHLGKNEAQDEPSQARGALGRAQVP